MADNTVTKLIIINGAPGVGKSAISNILFSKLGNSAFLDGDDVWRINPFEVTEKTRSIVERNIIFVLRNYIEAGYEYVILAWVLHNQSITERLLINLKNLEFKVHIFTLICSEEILVERRHQQGRETDIAIDRLRQSLNLKTEKFDTG
jgi:predicted ABC-type ATPase